MSKNMKKINIIDIKNIFKDKYIIPIYQRKYAWTDKEIEQLLEDIAGTHGKYYLGTLVVNENNGKYEVIDGQQRLTTLYLLMLYLKEEKYETIEFEARKNYDKALADLENSGTSDIAELNNGYNCIKNYFREHKNKKFKFVEINTETNDWVESEVTIKEWVKDRLNNVCIVRVHVPEDTDLNNYFEVMNTRGEQLELHHIAKSDFISAMEKNKKDESITALIWDACANMDSHIQMNFKKDIRDKIFNNDKEGVVEDVYEQLSNCNIEELLQTSSLKCMILTDNKGGQQDDNKNNLQNNNEKGEEKDRFKSIISFPYFLLYVNAVLLAEEKGLYDDKELRRHLEKHCGTKEEAKKFINTMLKCRYLFDTYIVKKDYQDGDDDNLKFLLKKYEQNDVDDYSKIRLILLQAILYITYTSQRNMEWITKLLKHLLNGGDASLESVTNLLENYCKDRIKKFYKCENEKLTEKKFNDIQGFDIQRIVFTYLDYILWCKGYKDEDKWIIKKQDKKWRIKHRSSIEHFFAQSLVTEENGWENTKDCFGNLALVSVSDNAKLSNFDTKAKVAEFAKRDVINHNPKLKIMASYIENGGEWTKETAKKHQEKMFKILAEEINKGM